MKVTWCGQSLQSYNPYIQETTNTVLRREQILPAGGDNKYSSAVGSVFFSGKKLNFCIYFDFANKSKHKKNSAETMYSAIIHSS